VAKENNSESLASFFHCLSLLEQNTYILYLAIAKKVEPPLINALFLEIAIDSKKHATILKGIGSSIAKSEVKPEECQNKVGEAWRVVEDLRSGIAAIKGKLTEGELPQLMKKLDAFETILGEEYNVFIQLKTLELVAKETGQYYNTDLENLKNIFVSIINDEKHHIKVLKTISDLYGLKKA
jgi:rubrerythrin